MASVSDNPTKLCKNYSENIAKSLKWLSVRGLSLKLYKYRQNIKILLVWLNTVTTSEEPDNYVSDGTLFEKEIDIAICQYIIKQKDKIIVLLNVKIHI